MTLDASTIKQVRADTNKARRVTNTARLFRLLSEKVIADLRAGKYEDKALTLGGISTYPIGEDVTALSPSGAFADIAMGQDENEFFAELYTKANGRESAHICGGFSLFYESDSGLLNAILENSL